MKYKPTEWNGLTKDEAPKCFMAGSRVGKTVEFDKRDKFRRIYLVAKDVMLYLIFCFLMMALPMFLYFFLNWEKWGL